MAENDTAAAQTEITARPNGGPLVRPGAADTRKLAFLFPGQGSQHVGMGQRLQEISRAARSVFAQADDTLGFRLSQVCFEGPQSELDDTINTQPAILTTSAACLAHLQREGPGAGQASQPFSHRRAQPGPVYGGGGGRGA